MNITKDGFLDDVKNHVLTVVLDNGLNRHIIVKNPETYNMYYELVTWDGSLCITGDCGTFVFNRLPDMFKFFRVKDLDDVNPDYWSEKCEAADTHGRGSTTKQFDMDKFIKDIKHDAYVNSEKSDRRAIKKELDDFFYNVEDEYSAIAALRDANGYGSDYEHLDFTDFEFEYCYSFTNRFIWCCYAIVYGIQLYDEAKACTRKVEG